MDTDLQIANKLSENKSLVKDSLQKWAEKKTDGHIINFDDKITVLDINESEVYKIDFITRFVRRTFIDQIQPFEGQTIPKHKGDLPDLWDYPTQNINHSGKDVKISSLKRVSEKMFDENAACYALPETFELTVCPSCVGKGKVICYRCDGSGRILNWDNKREYCPNCRGARKLICGTCDGKGKVVTYTGLAEFFMYNETNKILSKNIPPEFYNELEKLKKYKKLDAFELTHDNYKSVLTNNETLSHNADISKYIVDNINKTSQQLDFNHRVNKYIIEISSLKTITAKYEYEGKKYTVLLYGDKYGVCLPEEKFQKELVSSSEKNNTTINDNAVNIVNNSFEDEKTSNNDEISKKSRLLSLLICLAVGILGFHRIYVGKKKSGSLLGICTIFSFIIVGEYQSNIALIVFIACFLFMFLDLIKIFIGKFKDKDGNRIINWI